MAQTKAIEKGAFAPGSHLDLRPLRCRSPLNKNEFIHVEISSDLIQQLAGNHRNSKLFEAWACLYGKPPPINGIPLEASSALIGIEDAYASFRGIKRGCNDQNEGGDVYVLVTKPSITYNFKPSMACQACEESLEDGIVMITLLRMRPNHAKARKLETSADIIGWDFVSASFNGSIWLPNATQDRFEEAIW